MYAVFSGRILYIRGSYAGALDIRRASRNGVVKRHGVFQHSHIGVSGIYRGGVLRRAARGLCDTGNELCDLLSGKHIVICRYDKIAPIAPSNALEYFDGKISESLRIVPCRTVASETLIPIFKADIMIDGKAADGFVGITKKPLGDDVDCIFNPKIISI